MQATIEAPRERMVTITMTEKQAKVLNSVAANITPNNILAVGGDFPTAAEGGELFKEIRKILKEVL